MANILTVTGGATNLVPTTSWAAPNGLFPTSARNDGSVYGWASSTSTVTLPSTAEGDGYLIAWGFEITDTSSGRSTSSGKVVQTSGTGNFASAVAGGYTRDSTNNQSYASGWAFIDNPSASAQLQFQFVRDSDAPTGGTSRSFLQVVPLSYSDVGVYASTSTSLPGGTTPTQMTGFTGTDGTNITLSSNTVTVTGDNKRYLAMGSVSLFDSSLTTRTQRWCGFREDGTMDDATKSCMYIRNTSNDRIGTSFMGLYETSTASKTFDVFAYRGDGVAAGQGGADTEGGTTITTGAHAMVVVELNDSAEVFHSEDSTAEQALTSANTDLTISATADIAFNDSASFTRSSDTAVNIEQAMDVLLFANAGHARETVSSFTRWEGEGSFTIGGTTQSPVGIHGNFSRGDVGDGAFGSSYNSVAAYAVTSSDTVGYRHVRNSTTEDTTTQPGWVGFSAINLDTLASASAFTITADSGAYTYTGTDAALSAGRYVAGDSGTYAYTGAGAGILVGYGLVADGGSYAVTGAAAQLLLAAHIASDTGSYALTGSTAGLLFGARIASDSGAYTVTGATAELSRGAHIASDAGAYAYTGSDAALTYGSDNTLVADAGGYTYTGADAALQADRDLAADSGAYAYTGTAALLAQGYIMQADSGAYVLSGAVVDFLKTHALVADSGAYVITGTVVELLYGALGSDAVRALRHTLSPDFLRTSASPVKRRHTITPSNQRHTQ